MSRKIIQGKPYKPLVLEVIEKDPDGTPRVFKALYDDETVPTRDGMEFHVVFARTNLRTRRKEKGA